MKNILFFGSLAIPHSVLFLFYFIFGIGRFSRAAPELHPGGFSTRFGQFLRKCCSHLEMDCAAEVGRIPGEFLDVLSTPGITWTGGWNPGISNRIPRDLPKEQKRNYFDPPWMKEKEENLEEDPGTGKKGLENPRGLKGIVLLGVRRGWEEVPGQGLDKSWIYPRWGWSRFLISPRGFDGGGNGGS